MTSLTVGVLGGMGPAATIDFMERVLRVSASATDQDGVRMIVDSNPGLPDRNAAIAHKGPSPGPLLARMAQGLEAAGADFLVMACNTAHAFQADIERVTSIPFVSIVEETCAAAAAVLGARGAGDIGLLAAQGCLDAKLYQHEFGRRGLACRTPEEPQQARFMRALYAIKAGKTNATTAGQIAVVASSLRAAGASIIVSACTEVPLVLKPGRLGVSLIHSTDVLAAATVAYARGERPLPEKTAPSDHDLA